MASSYHSFRTAKGRRIWVRPLRADDASHLVAIFEALSPESRYLRFHEPLEAPDPALVAARAREMVEVTLRHGRGWLAFARRGNRRVPIGGVRWVRVPTAAPDEPPQAEIAVTVCDAFQGQGIGRELLRLAVLDAHAAGIRRLLAVVHGSNRAVMHLLAHAPVPLRQTIHAGEVYIEADIGDGKLLA
ncbi:MAG: GNAT family N-acetyltransferase, partial [Caldilineales bacterium]|nr:GNAT family N-acetyltransferase [Caldilineales bacterium]